MSGAVLTYADGLGALGLAERPGEEIVFTRKVAGQWPHWVYTPDLAGEPIPPGVYVATGRFRAGTVTQFAGRKKENLSSVHALVLDCDLKDRLGIERRDKAALAEMRALPDDALAAQMAELLAETRALLDGLGLLPSRIVNSGYGLHCWYLLRDEDQGRIERAQERNARLVEGVNAAAGRKVSDGVQDCGTRILRLPGSSNDKNPDRGRLVEVIGGAGGRWAL